MLFNHLKIYYLLLFIIACKETKPSSTQINTISSPKEVRILDEKDNKTDLEQVLEEQLNIGYSQLYDDSYDISDYKYSQKYLEVIVPFLKGILNSNVPTEIFKRKVKRIFGRTILPKSEKKYLTVILDNPCNRSLSYYRNDNTIDIRPVSLHIVKGENFITELYAIPEIIDYQKEFPHLFDVEKASDNTRISSDGSSVIIYKWKDIDELNNKRSFNLKLFIARNEYLFNDVKSHFEWLVNNDEYFMKSLITEFGYLDDEKLVEWFIKKHRLETVNGKSNGFEYGKMLWHKNCNNKVVFHNKILQKMKEKVSYCDDLNDYVYFLSKNNQDFDYLSFEDQSYMVAQIYHFIQNQTEDTFKYMGFFAEFYDTDNTYSNEFIKNNYYELEGFKTQWLKAKKVGNGVSH
ncbi:hypothetical protein [Olleya sp. HaHaR_3_96]|uniref:hypothetical protein n=1 Tax=Olleya sp. HaHaR_3_96 TaxID=2745560 RepID=UPI001C4FBAE7|nr:hypothetical protein [Olleya sp. HaHaR_3_96]QXP58220.1 hypothetical protein H0I26_09810 [Olleya sp. HaHaR_3_96]